MNDQLIELTECYGRLQAAKQEELRLSKEAFEASQQVRELSTDFKNLAAELAGDDSRPFKSSNWGVNAGSS